MLHELEPAVDQVPARHWLQELASLDEYSPFKQFVQLLEPADDHVPPEH